MKFTLSTKPLINAVNLVIIDANISKFYHKSVMVQLTANNDTLRINTEATSICSEVRLMGVGDGDETRVFLDASLFKKLISTIKTTQVELEFVNGGMVVHYGKSSFSLPSMADAKDGSFVEPRRVSELDMASAIDIDKAKWKFIKEHQLYARATSYSNPVYTFIWTGKNGNVIVGDLDKSLFTISKSSQLDMDCMISDTIINLLVSLPDGTKIVKDSDTYVLHVAADSYEYTSQITPRLESEQNGFYNAEAIEGIMDTADEIITVDGSEIITALNQSSLLSLDKDPKIVFSVDAEGIHLRDRRINALIPVDGEITRNFSLTFKPEELKNFVANSPNSKIEISPRVMEDEVVGIILSVGDYKSALGGEETE
jgi:hypothetical protein